MAELVPDLTGRVVAVTGGSRGIGRAVVLLFAAHGAAVVVNGRDAGTVGGVVHEVRSAGGRAEPVVGPAEDPAVAGALAAMSRDRFGREVDVLVTCAGTAEPEASSILSVTPQEWQGLIDSHLTSVFQACRAVVPGMVARGSGTVVTTASHAFTGMYGGTGYPAGKGGVVSLTYALAADLRASGVRVNAVAPGARTRLSSGPAYEAGIDRLHRRGLIADAVRDASLDPGDPAHVAALYVFLGSDLSAPLTGEVLAASGGYLGRFTAPSEEFVAWRDHHDQPPYTPAEIAALLEEKP